MKRLVLFDIDGTLLSMRRGLSKKLFADVFAEFFSVRPDESLMPDFSGMTDLAIMRAVCGQTGLEFDGLKPRLEEFWEAKAGVFRSYCTPEFIEVLPGVTDLMAALETETDICSGLLTGNFRRNAYQKLGGGNLDHHFAFGAFGCDEEFRENLPPLAIERANDHYGGGFFDTANTVIIGDSEKDIACAQANSIRVIAVATGGMDREALGAYAPDMLIDDMKDAVSLINFIRN